MPVEVQTAGGSISKLVRTFPNLLVREVDGCDPLASLVGPDARRPRGAAPARGRPSCTRTSSAPTPTRSPTTRPSTARPPSARRTRARPAPRCSRAASWRRASPPRTSSRALREEVDREVAAAADTALAAPPPAPQSATLHVYSPDVRPDLARPRHRARPPGRPQDDGGPAERVPPRRDGARPAHRRLRAGRGRLLARGEPRRGQGQGRRLQGHAQPAAPPRVAPRLQHAPRRGQHRRPRHRHGHPRAQAGGGDPVLRLHLARLHADPQRARPHPLALERLLQVPRGHPRDLRGLPPGRGGLPQPVRRGRLHPRAGAAGGDPLERAGRERPAAHRDPLRRPGALPRAQAPLPPDPQQGGLPRARLHDPLRQGGDASARGATSPS